MSDFRKRLGREILFFDGAMGTCLQASGLAAGECPENRNITDPELIYNVHKEYLLAGADVILANTFGANRIKLDGKFSVTEVVKAGIGIAKKAVSDFGKKAYVALDIGSTGKLLKPYGSLEFEEAYNVFAEMVKAGAEAGADLVSIETMTDIYETKAAILAVKENCDLPLTVTVSFDGSGKMLTGTDPEVAATVITSLGADCIGINCGLGPEQCLPLIKRIRECTDLPLTVSPNAGLPVLRNGKTVYELSPEKFAVQMKKMVDMGASLLGGCCGTTPAHIKAMTQLIGAGIRVQKNKKRPNVVTVVTSYSRAVPIGIKPVVIGERLNPTGKSKLKAALRSMDMEYVKTEALGEEENGAAILDVNAGLPDIDEGLVMTEMIKAVQSVSALPLQIDTASPEVLEKALRIYNGRPLINSVNGKEESLGTVLPLAKKYGACVVALALDESGIPETVEGRVEIVKKIVERAAKYGIPRNDIIVDTLTMTIGTGDNNARITLDALGYVSRRMKLKTVLGVSNVSFGLPVRESVTASFLTMALHNGLSAAIINPSSAIIMNSFNAYLALSGQDTSCLGYIGSARQIGEIGAPGSSNVGSAMTDSQTVKDAIIKGLTSKATEYTAKGLETRDSLDIIDNEIMPALNQVGDGFANGKIFLPQLLMSAEAAKASFDIIKKHMASNGKKQEKKGRVILATVKGDVHDIGKNIVKVMLENYGFEVIDLGKDVPPEAVLNAAKENAVQIIGLSALMTTTVSSMEETIALLKAEIPHCFVMVGGAVLNPEYAEMIGADKYCADAMETVRCAEQYYL